MNKKTIRDIDVNGKKVLVRVDFNVPLSSKNPADTITVTDDTRIQAALPTLNYLLDNGAALICVLNWDGRLHRQIPNLAWIPSPNAPQNCWVALCKSWMRWWARV